MGTLEPIPIRVDYDFASTLCYVAHRSLARIAPALEELGLELVWSPLDLARLMGWPRGATVEGPRRENACRVARELEVPVRMPVSWLDSRRAHAIVLEVAPEREPTWRERVWTAVFEEGRELDHASVDALAKELSLGVDAAALERGLAELESRTRAAAGEMVTGVPNFMLGGWPFGGIQTDDTMLSIFRRFAAKQRQEATS